MRRPPRRRRRRRPWKPLGWALLALGPLLAANSVLGPLVLDVIRYRFSEALVAQGVGLDAVSLAVVAPLAVIAGVLCLRRRPAGPALALGVGAYVAYMAIQYVVGPDYLSLPGNNERYFPFHLGLFVLGLATTAGAWATARGRSLPPTTEAAARRWGRLLLVLAALLALRYLPMLIGLVGGDPSAPEFRENPTSFLLIAVLDLGVFLPMAVAAGLALGKGRRWARRALHLVLGWFALVALAVAAMAVVMWQRGEPAMSRGHMVGFCVVAVMLAALQVRLVWPLLAGSGGGERRER